MAIDANVRKLVLSHLTPVTSPRVGEIKDIIKGLGFRGKSGRQKTWMYITWTRATVTIEFFPVRRPDLVAVPMDGFFHHGGGGG